MVYVDKRSFCVLEKILRYKYVIIQYIEQIQHQKFHSLNTVVYR